MLDELRPSDAVFILELLNTPGWLQFIGDRGLRTIGDAHAYIEKICANPDICYRVARLKNNLQAIGIVTFIKRDYLEHHDIGFAFLPEQGGKGFAQEASAAVLAEVKDPALHENILATTVPTNVQSIRLLTKLGFIFRNEIERDGSQLQVWSLSTLR